MRLLPEIPERYRALVGLAAGAGLGWGSASGRVARPRLAQGGLRFHDLRHSYATWLVSDGVPINDVVRVMGHEQISTTLDRYTHAFETGGEGQGLVR